MTVRRCRGWFVVVILIASCTAAGTESQTIPAVHFSPSPLAANPNIPLTASPDPFPNPSPIPTTLLTLTPSVTPTSPAFLTPTSNPTAIPSCSDPKGTLSIRSFDSATLHRKVDYSLYLPPCYGFD